jgi:hypothetical protein
MKLILSIIGATLASAALGSPAHAVVAATPSNGQVVVVQAVPGAEVDVTIDGKPVKRQAQVGSLIGPLSLSPGSHELVFSGAPGGRTITTSLRVEPRSSSDVVLHLPASVDGAPVVNTYRTPHSPIGPDKARILLAHTATVAPADVRFDGKIVFTNIANGEFADADVPAGSHRVSLLATGTTKDPILGPLDVKLAPRTATMVYAVGRPSNGSMNVIVHTVELSSDGSIAPQSVDTGSAGLAAGVHVTPFTASPQTPAAQRSIETARPFANGQLVWFAGGLGILLLGALSYRARRRLPLSRPRGHPRSSMHV